MFQLHSKQKLSCPRIPQPFPLDLNATDSQKSMTHMQDVSHMHPACLWTIACVLAVHVLRNEHGEVIIDNHWVPTSRNTHRQCKQCHTTSINKRQVHLRERNLHQLEGEVLPCPPWSGPREVAQWRRLHQLPLLAGQTGHLWCLPSWIAAQTGSTRLCGKTPTQRIKTWPTSQDIYIRLDNTELQCVYLQSLKTPQALHPGEKRNMSMNDLTKSKDT